MTCSACPVICEHLGAALSLILEEKTAFGLAAPPPERVPVESLSEAELTNPVTETANIVSKEFSKPFHKRNNEV